MTMASFMLVLILAITGGFILGSLPFSVWIGRLALRKDIREYGDHNPGATNVLRAGGWAWGGLALLLDMSKGAIPAGLAGVVFGLDGLPLALIAISPVAGHAFSPFLGFNGGKAIAATGGMWIGLTGVWVLMVGLAAMLFFFAILRTDAWSFMLAMVVILIYLLLVYSSGAVLLAWLGTFLITAWKHRTDLLQPPGLRPRLTAWVRRA